MLEVGVGGGMTHAEQQAHFALWAMMAAPLIAGNDLRSMSEGTLAILTNPEVIAVNQDALGLQGVPVRFEMDGLEPSHSVWSKPLNESGARAVLLLNASTTTAELGFESPSRARRGASGGARPHRSHGPRADDATFRASVPGTRR
jgi:alpha-galactosidase